MTRATGRRRTPRETRDLRGWLTFTIILGTYGIALAQLLTGNEDGAVIPPWAAQLAGVAVTGYFMTKGAERHAKALMDREDRSDRGN